MSQRCKIAFIAAAFAATSALPAAAAELPVAPAPKAAKVATVKKPAKPQPIRLVSVEPRISGCHLGCPGFLVIGVGF